MPAVLFRVCTLFSLCDDSVFKISSPAEGSESIFYLISELLYNNFMSNKYPSATTARIIIPASTTEYT